MRCRAAAGHLPPVRRCDGSLRENSRRYAGIWQERVLARGDECAKRRARAYAAYDGLRGNVNTLNGAWPNLIDEMAENNTVAQCESYVIG